MKKETGAEMINAAGRSYGELIREYRKRKGLSQAELGKLAQVRQHAVGVWEAGRSLPDLASVPAICRELSLPLSVFFGVAPELSDEDLTARFRRLNDYNQQVILHQMDMLYSLQGNTSARKLVQVYESDLSAAAGVSFGIGEESGRRIWLVADDMTSAADEIIRVNGDSMEPSFFDGDQVLVQHCSSLREGEIGIFVAGSEGYIKEYRPDGLYSHNPRYPAMHFAADEPVRCVGRVLGRLLKEQIARPEEVAAQAEAGPQRR